MSRVTTVFMRIFAEAYILSAIVRSGLRDLLAGVRQRGGGAGY